MAYDFPSPEMIRRKNATSGGGVFTYIMDLETADGILLHVTKNSEDLTYMGHTYQSFPFDLDIIGGEKAGENPQSVVKVGNVTRALMPYVEMYTGFVGAEVVIQVINASDLTLAPLASAYYICTDAKVTSKWITFTLGTESPMNLVFPRNRLSRNGCSWRYKGLICKYQGTVQGACDKTLAACRERNNSHRYGGTPGVGRGGLDI